MWNRGFRPGPCRPNGDCSPSRVFYTQLDQEWSSYGLHQSSTSLLATTALLAAGCVSLVFRNVTIGVTYAQLAEKLTAFGAKENERNLANKISRGSFTAAFFMMCMDAIGAHSLNLET